MQSLQKQLPLVIVILALVIRFGASMFFTSLNAEPQKDERIFTKIAWNLATGNGYSLNGEIPTARRPPAYPLLIAGVFSIFGKSWVAARVVNVIMSAITIWVIYLIGCRLFNKTVGTIAALISAFYPAFIQYSLRLYSDTFFVFILSIVILLFIHIYESPDTLKMMLVCGVLIGMAILTRSELLFFIPFVFIWTYLLYRRFLPALRAFAIILIPLLLIVGPWLIRNYIILDGFMVSANLGRVMWGVHNPDTFSDLNLMGGWSPPPLDIRNAGDVPRDSWDLAYRYLPEREWDQQHIELALDSIKQNLRLLPRMGIYKLHRLIFTPGAVRNLVRFPLVYCFFFGLILLLVSGDRRYAILYMLMLYAVFITLIFYTSERIRMGVDLALIVIASYGIVEQIKFVRQRANKNGLLPNKTP
jgi:4-amino-4-deoxy-L-arabinose transferase-like glycosyltransferase